MTARAILFDLGDTLMFQAHAPDRKRLYATIGEHVRPLLREWKATEIDLPEFLAELYGAIEVSQAERRARGLEVDAPFVVQGALASHGVDASPERAETFWAACSLSFPEWGWQLYPDTLDTLRRVRSIQMHVAIVSNGTRKSGMYQRFLTDIGITDDLFDALVSSADVLRPKPQPEPFKHALDDLHVAAEDAIFVGDDLEADVGGAKALGMTTVWKLNGRHEVPEAAEADHTIHDLWELFTLGILPEAAAAAILPQESLMPHEDANADRY
jgi:putative hydrolase of the HAD superfamily